jgi:endo-1,4-beta-xylanase
MMPQEGKIDFGLPDGQLKLAQSGGMEVRAQTLVYSYFLPDWLKQGSFTQEQLISMIRDNVKTIMTRYKGEVTKWNVVNEMGFFPPYDSTDFFYHRIGQQYVAIAFQAARETDPSALLYLDDFGVETVHSPKYEQDRRIVNSLKQAGLIDAMGVQLHIDASKPPTKQDLIEAFQSWELPVFISELDVDLRNVDGADAQRFALQAEIFRTAVQAALDSEVCRDIVFWGFGDKYSWLEQPEFNGSKNADPTIFDDDLGPKPAYFAIRDLLQEYADSHSS